MTRLTATEAVRSFSAVLSRGGGDEIEGNGAPVALIGPPRPRFMSSERFRELLDGLPEVDEDFAGDMRRLRAGVGAGGPLAVLIETISRGAVRLRAASPTTQA